MVLVSKSNSLEGNTMPVYEYECEHCNEYFTKLQKLSDLPIDCPICGQITKKIISAPNFNLKLPDKNREGHREKEAYTRKYEASLKQKKAET
jgi:putative FmdB family regulatory protein